MGVWVYVFVFLLFLFDCVSARVWIGRCCSFKRSWIGLPRLALLAVPLPPLPLPLPRVTAATTSGTGGSSTCNSGTAIQPHCHPATLPPSHTATRNQSPLKNSSDLAHFFPQPALNQSQLPQYSSDFAHFFSRTTPSTATPSTATPSTATSATATATAASDSRNNQWHWWQ
jgi:hypothetical protein